MPRKKTIQKECKHHGLCDHSLNKEGKSFRYRCKQCNVVNVLKRRKKVKLQAIEYKGGQCQNCGYKKCQEALEFHHLDPTQKDFGLSTKGICRSWERVKAELDKCILLCANCHREVEYGS